MFPVVSIFLAGLYVGLGSLGILAAAPVSNGSFPGIGGAGMALGPTGGVRERLSNDDRPPRPFGFGTNEIGELWTEDGFEFLESGLPVSIGGVDLSFANRSLSASHGFELFEVAIPEVALDIAFPCSFSGFGEGDGLTLGGVAAPFVLLPFIWGIDSFLP